MRRLRRCRRLCGGILDCRCARRSAKRQVGTKGWSFPIEQRDAAIDLNIRQRPLYMTNLLNLTHTTSGFGRSWVAAVGSVNGPSPGCAATGETRRQRTQAASSAAGSSLAALSPRPRIADRTNSKRSFGAPRLSGSRSAECRRRFNACWCGHKRNRRRAGCARIPSPKNRVGKMMIDLRHEHEIQPSASRSRQRRRLAGVSARASS